MGNLTKQQLEDQPQLKSLSDLPDFSLVNANIAAGCLGMARSSLDKMAKAGEVPPIWVEQRGKRLYSIKELKRYVTQGEEAVRASLGKRGTSPASVVQPSKSFEPFEQLSDADERAAGLDGPVLRKGRRRKSPAASFVQFLSIAAPDDLWPFALIPRYVDANDGVVQPVPLESALARLLGSEDGGAMVDAEFQWMTLGEYEAAAVKHANEMAAIAAANARADRLASIPPVPGKRKYV